MPTATPSLDTVFSEAIEIPDPAARAAYLDRACGSDPALRAKAGKLVAAHFWAGDFLVEPLDPAEVTTAFGPAPHAADELGPGVAVGPYVLREQIGEGGMGLVFVAEQTRPVRRKVAVKVIKPGMDSKQVIARFEAERQALALMDHPNIAKVHDAGTTDRGRPYFVMELVKGEPLTDYCDAHRLTVRARLDLFLQVCRAVQHAHQKGVIHRDLKPSNVLVAVHDVTAVAKVIDFGVAKAVGQALTDKTVYTAVAQMVGTPLYMSPEQAGQSSLDVDTRTDVYALGVLLYELLTGTTPIDPATLRAAGYDEVRRMIREDEPARPSARLSTLNAAGLMTVADRRRAEPGRLARQVKGELDWVVMKCLEKDRNRRYESANALADDIERYLADEAVAACPPSAGYRLQKFSRRNKVALVTMGTVAAALLLGTAVSLWQATEANAARRRADDLLVSEQQAHRDADVAAERERTMAEETRQKQRHTAGLLAGLQLDEGLKRLNEGNAEGLNDLVQACETAQDIPELREPIARFWAVAYQRWSGWLVHAGPRGREVAFSPDGRLLGVLGGGGVHLFDTVTGQSRRLSDLEVPENEAITLRPGAIVFSPDGRLLAANSEKLGVRFWNTATGLPVGQPNRNPPARNSTTALAFSPDGKLLASNGTDGTVQIWDATTARPYTGPLAQPVQRMPFAFSPNGRLFATGSTNGTLRLWDVATGKEQVPPVRFGRGHLSRLMFTADSSRVVAISNQGAKHWLTESGNLVKEFAIGSGQLTSLSPDGKTLAVGTEDWKVRRWDMETGQQIGQPLPLPRGGSLTEVLFSPDGKRLAVTSQDSITTVFELGGGPVKSVALFGTGQYPGCQWSPDGRYLATTGLVRLWRVEEPTLNTIPLSTTSNADVSADGKQLGIFIGSSVLRREMAPDRDFHHSCESGVTCLAFSPDGKWLATGTRNWKVNIWDRDGKLARTIDALDLPYALAWSSDSARIVVAAPRSGILTDYNRATGESVGQSFNHGDWVRAVSYSPDGSMLATLGGDDSETVVRLWSTRFGPKHLPLVLPAIPQGGGHSSTVRVNFSRDGQLLCAQPPKGGAILFRLPQPPDLREMWKRTQVALGAFRGSNGQIYLFPTEDWAQARAELAKLDQERKPIPWENMELAFAADFSKRDQIIKRESPKAILSFVENTGQNLEKMKATLGPNHPDTISRIHKLASAYMDAGKTDLALPLLEQTLETRRALLGPVHPDTLDSMANLAMTYGRARKFELALPLYEEALEKMRTVNGPDHTDTLATENRLAVAYQAVRKYELAIPLYEHALERRTSISGADHPSTLIIANNLATAYMLAGKLALSASLYEQTWERRKAKLGPNHVETLSTMTSLAAVYVKSDKYALALPLLKQMLENRRFALGPDHHDTLVIMNNLATAYLGTRQPELAVPLLEQAMEKRRATGGADHAETFVVQSNLISAYLEAGKPELALPLLRAQAERAKKQGPETAKTANALALQGMHLLRLKEYIEAEPVLRECLAIREKLQPDVWATFNTRSMLGGALLGQKKYEEAEPLLLKGYEGMKARESSIPPTGIARLTESVERVVELYVVTNRPDKAKEWRAKVPPQVGPKPREAAPK